MLLWAGLLALVLPAAAVPVDRVHVVRDGPSVTMVARQASASTLAMKRDWNLDAKNVEQLGLQKSAKMLYALDSVPLGQRPIGKEPYAWMTMEKTDYPILQTINSDYIGDVKCDLEAGWVKMAFNNRTAYDWAWNNWTERREEWGDYVVITPENSCKNYGPEDRAKWLRAKSESRDDGSLTITCDIEDIPFEEAVGEEPVDLEFENFNQNTVNVNANDNPGDDDGFEDLGSELLREPSGDTNFDEYLDFKLGKMSPESFQKSNLSELGFTYEDLIEETDLPDLADENIRAGFRNGTIPQSLLRKRRIGDRIKRAAKKVGNAVKSAAKAVGNAVKAVGEAVVEVAKKVEEGIAKFTTIDKSINKDIDVDTTKIGDIVSTPFDGRQGYRLFSGNVEKEFDSGKVSGSLEAFCVDCFIQTDLNLRGKIKFIVSRLDLEEGFIELDGNAAAGLGIGLVAELAANKEFKKQLVSIPLQPFAIPNVFVLGPKLDISAGLDLGLEIEGQMLAGVRLDWPAISARADVKGNNFARGFTPEVTPIFEVEGEIALTVTLFLEYAFGFGLDVLNGLFDKSVEIILKPSIFSTVAIGGAFDLENGGGFSTGDEECPGVTLVTGLGMEVGVNVFDIDSAAKVLFEATVDVDSRCFPIGQNKKRSATPMLDAAPHSRRQVTNQSTDIGATTFPGGKVSKMFTRDAAESFRLRYSPNGNVYAVSDEKVDADDKEWSGWFVADETGAFIYGDSHGRTFHGYSDTIEELGVSRLRLHSTGNMPTPAWPMFWASVVDEDVPEEFDSLSSDLPVMIVSDMAGDIYFPVHCVYTSNRKTYGKIFVVKDLEAGIATLRSNTPEVMARVTGDPVETCGYISVTNGEKGVDISQVAEDSE